MATDQHQRFEAFLAKCEAETAEAWPNLVKASRHLSARTKVRTGSGSALIVNQVVYPAGRSVTDDPEQITATADGRYYDRSGWHEGDSDIDDWVYFERWVDGIRVAHGFIDPVSRRLVQSG